MVAVCDYTPSIDSPNPQPHLELPFSKGKIITVYGNMVSAITLLNRGVCVCVLCVCVCVCVYCVCVCVCTVCVCVRVCAVVDQEILLC